MVAEQPPPPPQHPQSPPEARCYCFGLSLSQAKGLCRMDREALDDPQVNQERHKCFNTQITLFHFLESLSALLCELQFTWEFPNHSIKQVLDF